MFLQSHKRTLLLSGLAAGLGVLAFLANRGIESPRFGMVGSLGETPGLVVAPVAIVQPVGLASASASQKAKISSSAVSIRQILPRLEQAVSDWRGYRPQTTTIAPYADLALDFEMTSVREENGRTIWRGRNALSGAFLVTVATRNEWHAVLDIPAASGFEFHISGQMASVMESKAEVLCGNNKLTAAAMVSEVIEVGASQVFGGGDGASDEEVNFVDVLFFYDGATLTANGNNTQRIETTIAGLVESANVVLQNSGVKNLQWRYVAAYQVPHYTATGSLQDDLNLISNSSNDVGGFVAGKSQLHGVDQVMLFVATKRGDNYDGLGWVPNGEGAVAHSSVMVWDSGYVILAHEMAHNFGCRHDRQTEGVANSDGKYGYGFRFNLNGQDTGTIMSYAAARVPFFSNPDRMYAGVQLGIQSNGSDEANNARVLVERAGTMARYRDAEQKPIITNQPKSTKIRPGEALSLGVSAIGGQLTFQWKKNGVDLPGATSNAYVKSGAAGTDEGVYSVMVKNDQAQVSSDNASVALADTASVSTTSPSASNNSGTAGGSGGGGAIEPWVLAMLAALGSLRLISRARHDR